MVGVKTHMAVKRGAPHAAQQIERRECYQVSLDPTAFFEESDAALARASQQNAQ
jgi:hypothetical protein